MTPAVRPARIPEELDEIRALFREYQADAGIDLCFQGFDEELATLPGKYAPPRGALLCAEADGKLVGCIALRPLQDGDCEMKRLFVRPAYRSTGAGRALAEAIVDCGRRLGYRRMLLDTVPAMARAQSLYERLGFHDVPPYTHNPLPGARYMALSL